MIHLDVFLAGIYADTQVQFSLVPQTLFIINNTI